MKEIKRPRRLVGDSNPTGAVLFQQNHKTNGEYIHCTRTCNNHLQLIGLNGGMDGVERDEWPKRPMRMACSAPQHRCPSSVRVVASAVAGGGGGGGGGGGDVGAPARSIDNS